MNKKKPIKKLTKKQLEDRKRWKAIADYKKYGYNTEAPIFGQRQIDPKTGKFKGRKKY